jgi:hypothetical protein
MHLVHFLKDFASGWKQMDVWRKRLLGGERRICIWASRAMNPQIATQRQSHPCKIANYDLLGSYAYGHPIFGIETCYQANDYAERCESVGVSRNDWATRWNLIDRNAVKFSKLQLEIHSK